MSRLRRSIPGVLAVLLASMVWATTARAASISAAPNPCPVAYGQSTCTTTLTWNATDVPQGQIWFSTDGGPEEQLACGNFGTQDAAWIVSGHSYAFTLYQSVDCAPATQGAARASVVVAGTVAPPVFSMAAGASGTVGQGFGFAVSATGATRYSATGLPPGLSLSTFLGTVIQGVPTTAGAYTTTVFASNAGGTVSQNVVFTFTLPPPPVITSSGFASGTIGTAFTYQITATNNPTSFNAAGLPAGLSLNAASGQISGAPTAYGSFFVTLYATNAGGTGQMTLSLTIANIPPVLTCSGFWNGIANQFVSYSITATHDPLSYSATNLPPGVSLNPISGVISGVVPTHGIWIASVGATNSAGTATQSVGISILPPPPVITGPASAAGTVGVSIGVQMQATNQGSWSATGLPPGLAINWINGSISGTPTTAGTFAASIQTASASGAASAALTVTILPAPLPIPPAITQQPVSMTISAGQTATFSVVATGTAPLTYQWSKNGTPISGATGAGYTTPAATLADNGAQFSVVVNNMTNLPATSQAANLTVNSLATVAVPTFSPEGGGFTQSVSVTLNCATTGAQIRYTTDNSPPTSVSPLYASALTLTATTVLRVKAFHAGMNDSAETSATFVMNESPSITQQPSNQIISVGQTAVFAVTASGTAPLTYQWSKNGTPISGATDASYTTPATTLADNGAQFSVVVNNVTNLPATSTPATLTVNPQPPVALFSANPTFGTAPLTVSFNASASYDPDGTIVSYAWTFGDGQTDSGLFPSHTYSVAGTYTARLTVTDNASATSSQSTTITVQTAVTLTSIAVAPPPGTLMVNIPYTFTATAFDQFGNIIVPAPAFTWSAPGASIANGIFTAGSPGSYTVSASAGGISGSVTVSVFSPAQNVPVITSPSFAALAVGTPFSYQIQATNSPTGFAAATLPPGLTINTTNGQISGTPTSSGSADVLLSATNGGGTGQALLRLQISPIPSSGPGLSGPFGPNIGTVGIPLQVTLLTVSAPTSVSASGLPPGVSLTLNGASAAFTGTPTTAGFYFSQVTVTNAQGSTTGTFRFSINPLSGFLPTVEMHSSPSSGNRPLPVTFDATGSLAPFGSISGYLWAFGDGSTGSGATVSHTFQNAGTYMALLTIKDDQGRTAQAFTQTIVTDIQTPATLTVGSVTGTPGGSPVTFSVTYAPSAQASASYIAFYLTLPPNVTFISAKAGKAASDAGKALLAIPSGNQVNIGTLAISANTVIAAGDVADVTVQITNSAALGTYALNLPSTSVWQPNSAVIPTTVVPGVLTVAGSLPTPQMSLPATLSMEQTLTVGYPPGYEVQFTWTVTPIGAAAGARAAALAANAQSGGTRTVVGPQLNLASLEVSPGPYHIAVIAQDSLGRSSLPAQADVTVVEASTNLSSARVYPNPWRGDRPTNGITFDGLTPDCTVKIFTLSGRWVRTLPAPDGGVTWDMNNDSGDRVASGLYIYLITDHSGGKTHGQLAIIK